MKKYVVPEITIIYVKPSDIITISPLNESVDFQENEYLIGDEFWH